MTVSLGDDGHIAAVLGAILRLVAARNGRPARRVGYSGRRKTVHPQDSAQVLLADCRRLRGDLRAIADEDQILGPHEAEALHGPQLTLVWGDKSEGPVH